MSLKTLSHPLATHLLAKLRDVTTSPEQFRQFARTLTTLLIIEATFSIRTRNSEVQTPLENTSIQLLDQGLAVVPILRAGLSMLEPALNLFPDVAVGYIGLERDHKTAVAHGYYCKIPKLEGRYVLCVDPMLATGGSASQALRLIKAQGGEQVVLVTVIAAPEGIERVQIDHPDVQIVTAAVDRELNNLKYIVPGLGDFGDRLYGTG